MELEDITRVVASYLDNSTLQKIYLTGAMPSLITISRDQHFWHARVETLSGMKFSFSRVEDWKDTYRILARELPKSKPFFYNKSDNILVLQVLSSLGFHPTGLSCSLAAENGKVNILKYILQEGSVNPGVASSMEVRLYLLPLIAAAQKGHLECVKLLLADPRVNPNAVQWTTTAFGEACRGGHALVVEYMLSDKRVNEDVQDEEQVLCIAVSAGHIEVVKILLADPRIVPDMFTLITAINDHREDILELLLQDKRISLADRQSASKLWARQGR